ncbi:MAG TPA: hypothetical protein DEB65_08755 [Staphylococcus sp.]|uniref:hypothetical protein n=1 Tax=Mammaliicoccus lentus TaxID=42858 RepID=UPI000CD324DA|nr:hypothetical protein [Mammaliicoccus lentus]POA03716.1 hypothetical protein CD135_09730 [Mammaliicoccus lentus]SUM50709.1 Uncharacterised protein [Mammaliicoccus lentus]HBV04350.1 hypothetical protein [Staphylococcus sp.]
MIYNKDVAFPYPVLTNNKNGYQNSIFEFDITDLIENNANYIFNIHYKLSSEFIKELVMNDKAVLVFIISSQDNYFIRLKKDQREVIVPKSRMSLSNRTSIQLHIQSTTEINMENCEDLTSFYREFKSRLKLKKHVLLGYSNVVKYQGTKHKPLLLFEKSIDEDQKNAFQIELSENTIVLRFNSTKYLIGGNDSKNNIQNMFLYNGLSRALHKFIINNNKDDEEYIDIDSLNGHVDNGLDQKLLDLMNNKGVKELYYDNIDDVIARISDKIIEKYVNSIERVMDYGD